MIWCVCMCVSSGGRVLSSDLVCVCVPSDGGVLSSDLVWCVCA